jgi:hypothetical protein
MMPDEKKTAATVLTGSTNVPAIDASPRAAFSAFITAGVSFTCVVVGADATVTALAGTMAATGAVLATVLFDALIKPRLHTG